MSAKHYWEISVLFSLFPFVHSKSAITLLRSASMTIIHVMCLHCCYDDHSFFPPKQRLESCKSWPCTERLNEREGWKDQVRNVARVVLLTGWWISTFPFLECDIINSDVSFDAWSPDTFQYHLQKQKNVLGTARMDQEIKMISPAREK